jgi:hypothetical protein
MMEPTALWKFGGTSLAEPLPSACGGRADGRGDGLVVEPGGRDDSVVRTLPPLNVIREVVDVACTILIAAIERCADEHSDAPSSLGSLELLPVGTRG